MKSCAGALKHWEGSPGSLRSDSFGGQNCLYLPLACHSCLQALTHRRKLPMKSCAGPFEACSPSLRNDSWRPKLPVLARGVSQLSPSFDLKSQAAHEKLCGALWSIGRAVLDPLEVTAFAAKTACTCPWRVTAVSKLWPKVASCPWKAVRGALKHWKGSPGSLRSDSFCGQNCLYLPLACHSCLQALT